MTSVDNAAVVVGLSSPCRLSTPSPVIRESLGKRHGDMDDDEAPRAKRRFERVSAQFERFSISGENISNGRGNRDTSESEDEWSSNDGFVDDQITEAIVEEPDEESTSRVILNDCLQNYIDKMKKADNFGIPTREAIRGNELVIWRPLTGISDPFLDPTMKGRIQEVDNIPNTSFEVSTSDLITEAGESETETEVIDQPSSSQRYKPQFEDVTFQDDEFVEMECD